MKTESERKVGETVTEWVERFMGQKPEALERAYVEIAKLKIEKDTLIKALKSVDEMFSNPGKINKRTVAEQVRAALKLAGEEGE